MIMSQPTLQDRILSKTVYFTLEDRIIFVIRPHTFADRILSVRIVNHTGDTFTWDILLVRPSTFFHAVRKTVILVQNIRFF